METHRFAVGEIVLYAERRNPYFAWKAPYTIVSCIALEAAEPHYRIASVHRHEIRTAGEHELCRTPQPVRTTQQLPEQCLATVARLQPANLNLDPAEAVRQTPWRANRSPGPSGSRPAAE